MIARFNTLLNFRNALTLIVSIAMVMTLFGKSIIGISLAVAFIVSVIILLRDYRDHITFKNIRRLYRSKYFLAVGIVFASFMLSSVFAMNAPEAIEKTISYFLISMVGFVLYAGMVVTGVNLTTIMKVSSILAALCAMVMWGCGFFNEGGGVEVWSRSYGSVLAFIFPMTIHLALRNDRGRGVMARYGWYMCLFILAAGVIASGGRTAWLSLIGLLFVFPFFYPWEIMRKKIGGFALCLLLVVAGTWVGMQSYKENVGARVFEARASAMSNLERPASGRLTIWKNSVPYFFDKPWLGHGIESTPSLHIKKDDRNTVRHMHNFVFELWLETGLLGLLAFCSAMCIFLKSFIKTYFRADCVQMRSVAMAIFLSGGVYAVTSLSLTSMFNTWWFLYLIILLILLKLSERQMRFSAK